MKKLLGIEKIAGCRCRSADEKAKQYDIADLGPEAGIELEAVRFTVVGVCCHNPKFLFDL
ncbi:MAG: hypothetical protein K7J46_02005 [Bryobacter sp.]|nr:hypothetical protein [Bryobacter sp. CoA8 C33]